MLSDNRKLTLIKYQGTINFIAGLFIEETEKKHYFGFMPTETPPITINNYGRCAENDFGVRFAFIDRYQTVFEAIGRTFGKGEKMFSLFPIKPEEFDSLYKLLECIYDD